jgi:hypothetical protein
MKDISRALSERFELERTQLERVPVAVQGIYQMSI